MIARLPVPESVRTHLAEPIPEFRVRRQVTRTMIGITVPSSASPRRFRAA